MSDDQHGEGAPQGGGRWNPLPQGEYDDGATAFVQLPEGGIEALLSGDSPLAAPGHGYVPPRIEPVPPADGQAPPAAPGGWGAPTDTHQWPVQGEQGGGDRFTYEPQITPYPQDGHTGAGQHGADYSGTGQHAGADHAGTGQYPAADQHGTAPHGTAQHQAPHQPGADQHWAVEEPAAPGHDVTGHWSVPVAGGELPDESGEFTTSALAEQWGTGAPSTLPGGAAAPWATEPAGDPWGRPQEPAQHTPAGGTPLPEEAYAGGPDEGVYGTEDAYGPEAADAPEAAPEGPADGPAAPGAATETALAPEAAENADEAGPEVKLEPGAAAEPQGDRPEGEADDLAAGQEPGADPLPPHDDHPLTSYVLRVNGGDRPVTDAWIGESLLYVLRERLGLAGAKDGCSQGECGACNVQVDGRLVASCLVPAVTTAGSEVRTVEGLAADGHPSDVQRALARCGAVQCGFCVPGIAMTLHDLLEGNPAPSELETRQALCGNLCRCSGYRGVLDAVREVVAEREAHAAAEAEAGADGDTARIPHQAPPGAGGVNPSAFAAPGAFDTPGDQHQQYPPQGPYAPPEQDPYAPQDPYYGQDGGQA
ncbi:2Fe-2S iron-sulfur cluster-binding protein [Streptomyces sp. NPDC048242]|uniref:2Fe-2S iron-sulfur cluster-binding protein n=1 Tax=Streptomyces sp. NPDC048242 TaxID=3155026 RepID=UPI003443FACB